MLFRSAAASRQRSLEGRDLFAESRQDPYWARAALSSVHSHRHVAWRGLAWGLARERDQKGSLYRALALCKEEVSGRDSNFTGTTAPRTPATSDAKPIFGFVRERHFEVMSFPRILTPVADSFILCELNFEDIAFMLARSAILTVPPGRAARDVSF